MTTQPPEVYGVRETLAELKTLSVKLEREARKEMRQGAAPAVREASAGFAAAQGKEGAPLPGMRRGRLKWGPQDLKVTAVTGGRKGRDRDTWPLVVVRSWGGGASMFDMAGRRSRGTSTLVAMLEARFPRASRNMWPAVEAHRAEITAAVIAAVKTASDEVSQNLVYRPGTGA